MRKSFVSPVTTLGAVLSFALAMFASPVATLGQATPESDTTAHPAHIHVGVCPEPGEVVFPLNDVVPADGDAGMNDMGTPGALDSSMVGTPDAMDSTGTDTVMIGTPVADSVTGMESTTTVEASLDDILGAEHAINLHLSAEQLDVYIACGDISGSADEGELTVDLEELNDSGISGRATLTDNGDGTTSVHIEVRHVGINMDGTPMATPEP